MPCRLRKEEIMTIQVLAQKGIANTEVARQLGVCEGTVRYHRRRLRRGVQPKREKRVRVDMLTLTRWWTRYARSPCRVVWTRIVRGPSTGQHVNVGYAVGSDARVPAHGRGSLTRP